MEFFKSSVFLSIPSLFLSALDGTIGQESEIPSLSSASGDGKTMSHWGSARGSARGSAVQPWYDRV